MLLDVAFIRRSNELLVFALGSKMFRSTFHTILFYINSMLSKIGLLLFGTLCNCQINCLVGRAQRLI